MCPKDDSHLTLEFHDHYVIQPTIQFSEEINYSVNNLGEKGKPVALEFEYNSGNNTDWLSHGAFLEMLK